MIKLTDLLEVKHMTPAQKKKRGEIYDALIASGMSSKKAGPIATSKAINMSEEVNFTDKYDNEFSNNQKNLPDQLQKAILKKKKKSVDEVETDTLKLGTKYKFAHPNSNEEDEVEYSDKTEYPNGESMYNFKGKKGTHSLGKKSVEHQIKDLKEELMGVIMNSKEHHHDHEASMAKGELRDMLINGSMLYQMIEEGQNLPGWISAYITLASDYIHSVKEYMTEKEAGENDYE
jgi:uncharacterized protein YdaT